MGLFNRKKKAVADAPVADAADVAAGVPQGDGVPGAADEGDELVAVIMAAVAAYEAEQYRQTLYIRKLDRTAGTRPAWGTMGMQEAIDMRRM